MIDSNAMKIASLVGLAKIGLLSARTQKACALISDAADHTDYRDDLDPDFYQQIKNGNIRTDAEWSKGADKQLIKLL